MTPLRFGLAGCPGSHGQTLAGVMTGTAAVQYSSDALSGNAVVGGCLEADNILRECSGVAAAGWGIRQFRCAPRSASPRVREVGREQERCRRGRGTRGLRRCGVVSGGEAFRNALTYRASSSAPGVGGDTVPRPPRRRGSGSCSGAVEVPGAACRAIPRAMSMPVGRPATRLPVGLAATGDLTPRRQPHRASAAARNAVPPVRSKPPASLRPSTK